MSAVLAPGTGAAASPDYDDFDILLQRGPDGFLAQGKWAVVSFVVPKELDNVTESGGQWSTEAVRGAGEALFHAVFTGELLADYRSSYKKARSKGRRLRIRFWVGNVPELAWVPWEFLHDPLRGFMSTFADTTIVRFLALPDVEIAPQPPGPLRLLVVFSNPEDPAYPPVDVERERAALLDTLGSLQSKGRVAIEFLEEATLDNLQACLQRGHFHVLHFVGHSGVDSTANEGQVVLEDPAGGSKRVSATVFRGILSDRDLRLVVLNSCESARAGRGGLFSGVAQALVQAGVPAVVAMQFQIRDDAAGTLVAAFYRDLALGRPIDAAVAEARKSVANLGGTAWAAPVVFFREGDGRLFAPPPPSLRQLLLKATPYALVTLNWYLLLLAVKNASRYFTAWRDYLLTDVGGLIGVAAVLGFLIPVNWPRLVSTVFTRLDDRLRPIAVVIGVLLPAALLGAGQIAVPRFDLTWVPGPIEQETEMDIPQLSTKVVTRARLCDVGDLLEDECEKPLPDPGYLKLSYLLRKSTAKTYRLLLTVEPASAIAFADLRTSETFDVNRGTDRANKLSGGEANAIWIASAEPGIGELKGRAEVCLVARAKPGLASRTPAILRVSFATDREGKEVLRELERCWSLRDGSRVDCPPVSAGSPTRANAR